MGKNNRVRRAAKVRARRRGGNPQRPRVDSGGRPFGGGPPGESYSSVFANAEPSYSVRELVVAAWIEAGEATLRSESPLPFLRLLAEQPAQLVDREAERLLVDQVSAIWGGGWQPAELVRQAKRVTSSRAARTLIELAVAVSHLDLDDSSLDHRWKAQLATLDLPEVNGRRGWSTSAVEDLADRSACLAAFADAMSCLVQVPRLDPLIPPPGADANSTWPPNGGYVAATESPDPIIEKVRNLLAKAESTGFEAEAMAFTAKAQELMTRHAIDKAALASGRHRRHGEAPVASRIFVDAPYADAKSMLLHVIAQESRCRAVCHMGLDMSTVVGFSDDVAAVQLMFTSLLVQAQAALNLAARSAPPGTRTRSQSFRSAFYVAFAERIGERLRESNRLVTDAAAAELGESFLPVLADRMSEVDAVFDTRFKDLVSSRVRGGWDAAGFATGTMAANRAQLRHADLEDPVGGTGTPGETPALRST